MLVKSAPRLPNNDNLQTCCTQREYEEQCKHVDSNSIIAPPALGPTRRPLVMLLSSVQLGSEQVRRDF
jgi:hypothetical protein